MLQETAKEKEIRIFNHYKFLLSKDSIDRKIRFITIEYVCRFAKINPYKMGKKLMAEEYEILFDDSSISQEENKRKFKKLVNEI